MPSLDILRLLTQSPDAAETKDAPNSLLAALGVSTLLTACGGGGAGGASDSAGVSPPAAVPVPPVPAGVAAAASGSQVVLSWAAVSGAASYEVRRATASRGPYAVIGTSVGTTLTDVSVTSGTTYFYVVAALNAGGASAGSFEVSAKLPDVAPLPPTPVGLAAAAGVNQVTLTWAEVVGATSYRLSRSNNSGGPYQLIGSPAAPANRFVDEGLSQGLSYFYVIAAVGLGGQSPVSAEVNASPTGGTQVVPAVPTGVVAVAGNGQLVLSWTPSAGATSYFVRRALASGGPFLLVGNPATAAWTDTGLVNGTPYFYVVSANNSAGASANSVTLSATPTLPVQVPLEPTGLTALAGNGQVTLNWLGSTGATSYSVRRSLVSGGPYTAVGTATTTTYVDSALSNGLTYYYVVLATNSAGTSAISVPVGVTPALPIPIPIQPTSLSAVAGNAQVNLNWAASEGASSYVVRRGLASNGPFVTVATLGSVNYTDTGLTNGTVYFYVVAASNSSGVSANSASATATPALPIAVANAPAGLTATAGLAQVDLAWSTSAGATSYQVKRATSANGPFTLVGAPGTTGFVDYSVTSGTTYYYVVASVNAGGVGADTRAVSATPKSAEPEPTPVPLVPVGLAGTAGNAIARLTWLASNGATSYFVRRSLAAGGPFTLVGNPSVATYTDTGLANGTTYYYVVAANSAQGGSVNSAPVAVTPILPTQAPPAPLGVVATSGNGVVSLLWTASAGATSYQVKRATAVTGPFALVGQPSSSAYSDAAVVNGSTYFYVVVAMSAGGASPDSMAVMANPVASAPTVETISAVQAARFLMQAQFSASDAEISAVRSKGYSNWLSEQFSAASTMTGVAWLDSRGYGLVDNTFRYYDNSYPGDYMIWNQLIASRDAVRKRCALALSEFFVVSLNGLDFSWRSHAIAAWWDLLVSHTFGNFRQLLEAVTLNPAMGYYLNTKGNRKEDVARNRVPDENYGREVMQLFSLGLYQLNLDGTEKRDGQGNPLESYTQSDITNIARVFTGWDIDQSQNVPTLEPIQNRTIPSTHYTRLPMVLNAANHSTLAANFLGATVPAGTNGVAALKIAMDALFNHPNVGPFFGKQIIQRLVTSNPSPAYVARVATAFNNNGAGVRGDLRAVFAAVLLDAEVRSEAGLTQPSFGKLREPMVRFVQWARTFGVDSAKGSWKIGNLSNPGNQLGQSPLRSPSVFNFFRPGYVPPGTVFGTSKTPVPEFQLVNESSVGGYLNYMQGVIRSGIFVNAPDQAGNGSNASNGFDITANYSAELALILDPTALVARLNLLLCAGQLSPATLTLIVTAISANALTAASSDNAKRDRLAAAVLLVMASSEYLVQK